MQTNDRLTDTARWLRYAEEDLITAEILLKQPHLPRVKPIGTRNKLQRKH